ncbi:HK97 gp10 family phage protein [Sphingomonas yunnanensis]|uniref:HK97 gp10 family phage protein n=1 Tax=Sphingomonas yunnanensis TaxID=310400 RepID=UPI001CA672CE|nr:HK97 gp10 family phage protein [Sphingomonas yunnanensis]MBY9062303.1 HK97 gp10 family phage protein [Sphingomonas yunnanensis]
MAMVKGRERTRAYLRQLPGEIERKLLRGAARAAIGVVKDEAASEVTSDTVRGDLRTKVRKREKKIVATLYVAPGWSRILANWLEYGTDPHVISVDLGASGGRTARRINDQAKAGTLVIGGTPVGATVLHPGARAHPFLRSSLDRKGAEAIAAAQSYITTRAPTLATLDEGDDE